MKEFTTQGNRALQKAQQIKDARNHSELRSGHLLKGLLSEAYDQVAGLLNAVGVLPEVLSASVDHLLEKYPVLQGGLSDSVSPDLQKVIRGATAQAERDGEAQVSAYALLLSLVKNSEERDLRGIFDQVKLDARELSKALASLQRESKGRVGTAAAEGQENVLEKYGSYQIGRAHV